MLPEPKHIFIMQIGKQRYKDRGIYSDREFEEIMDAIHWNLPSRVKVFHFHGDWDKRNPVVNALPWSPVDIPALLRARACGLEVWDRRGCLKRRVLGLLGQFAVVDMPETEWFAVVEIDGRDFILKGKLQTVPVSLDSARDFVNRHHRHNVAALGHKFSVGLMVAGYPELVGVVIASTPKARSYGPEVLEVNRVCVHPPVHNGCSKLYGAALSIARVMGYTLAVTYTQPEEDAASVRAAGFRFDGMTKKSRGWDSKSRPRAMPERYPIGEKRRWLRSLGPAGSYP